MYEMWLVKHGKAYNGLGEKERRFEIFKDNLKFIDEHNSVDRTYKLGLNRFADLTNAEYRSTYLGTRMERRNRTLSGSRSERYLYKDSDDLPEMVDWREKGAVASVKDQGQCGKFSYCCYFGFVGFGLETGVGPGMLFSRDVLVGGTLFDLETIDVVIVSCLCPLLSCVCCTGKIFSEILFFFYHKKRDWVSYNFRLFIYFLD